MIKLASICVVLLSSFVAFAQDNSSELQLDSLIVKLHNAIELQRSIEVEEVKGVYSLTYWHFVPNLALNYDFINSRYYVAVSLSTGPFINHYLGKRQETRRLSAIDRRYDNQLHTQEIRLKSIYFNLLQRITNLELSHVIILNDIEIHKIKVEQHSNNEIDTETFLRDRSAILTKIRSHNIELSEIQKFLYDIELLTEHEINLDLSNFFVSPSEVMP